MAPKDKSLSARCPECDSRIYFPRTPDLGQLITCPECDSALEVVNNAPLNLDWAFEESSSGSDRWDDDDYSGWDDDEDDDDFDGFEIED